MNPKTELYNFLVYLGIPGIIITFVLVLIYFALNIPKFEAFGAWISRLFAWRSKALEKKYIELDIQSKIGQFSQDIAREIGIGKQPSVKIEWVDVKNIDREAFLKNGQLVLRMSTYREQEENVVHATIGYLQKTVLYHARNYFYPALDKSIDFTLANRVFTSVKDTAALDYFQEELVRPAVQTDAELHKYLQRLAEVDAAGYFTRILLCELANFKEKFPQIAGNADLAETKDFADFLFDIATRKDKGPLDFTRSTIKTTIVLVAARGKAPGGDVKPYLMAAGVGLQNGSRTIYICAWGKGNVSFAKLVIQALLKDNRMYLSRKQEYSLSKHPSLPAICTVFRSVVA